MDAQAKLLLSPALVLTGDLEVAAEPQAAVEKPVAAAPLTQAEVVAEVHTAAAVAADRTQVVGAEVHTLAAVAEEEAALTAEVEAVVEAVAAAACKKLPPNFADILACNTIGPASHGAVCRSLSRLCTK